MDVTPSQEKINSVQEAKTPNDSQSSSKKRKPHCCKFRRKLIANLSRHFVTIHDSEKEVVDYRNSTGTEKRMKFNKMMGEGDRIHNEINPQSQIILKRSKCGRKQFKRISCTTCDNFVSKKNFYTHLKMCNESLYNQRKDEKLKAVVKSTIVPASLNAEMKQIIVPKLREGPIRDLVMRDEMIIEHGNMLTEKFEGENQHKMISSILRIISKIFLGIKDRAGENGEKMLSTTDCFKQRCYKYFVETVRDIAGAGEGQSGEYKKPSTIHQYGQRFRHFAKTLVYQLRLKDERETVKCVEEWESLYDNTFSDRVASVARKQADRKTHTSRLSIPSMTDVQKLITFVKLKLEESYTALQKKYSEKMYKLLVKVLLLKL